MNSNVTIPSRVTVSGTANLILADGFKLTVNNGIGVGNGNSLTIYGQSGSTGTLETVSMTENYAGIGGGEDIQTAGTITINRGNVTAYGGYHAAGIGGTSFVSAGTITINGGTVTAIGGYRGAGIGGGVNGSGGTITISGGSVTAIGGGPSRGIGAARNGSNGTISLGWTNEQDFIYTSYYVGSITFKNNFLLDDGNGTVATAENIINGGKIAPTSAVHTVTVQEGISASRTHVLPGNTVTLSCKEHYNAVYSVNGTAITGNTFTMPNENVNVTAVFTPATYNITYNLGEGATAEGNPATNTIETDTITLKNPTRSGYTFLGWTGTDIATRTMTVMIPKGSAGDREYSAEWLSGEGGVLYIDDNGNANTRLNGNFTELTESTTAWGNGWYVAKSNVTISSRVTANRDVHLILADGYTLKVPKGITVASGKSLTIYGVESNNAGIGGYNPNYMDATRNAGTITINGGKINVTGGSTAAAIGGGSGGTGGTIIINGGTVSATGNASFGKGIGAGENATDATIKLGWTRENDSIYASNYNGTVTFLSSFMLENTTTVATAGNIGGKKIVPDDTIYNIKTADGITRNLAYTSAGTTVTLSGGKQTSYCYVINCNGTKTALDGNTFTMPGRHVYVETEPITYSITYDLDGGTVETANPTGYTIETETFTLNNPVKNSCTFLGWTGSNGTSLQTSVTIAKGSTGKHTYTATWTLTAYAITYTLNGGTLPEGYPASYTIEDEIMLASPIKEGYTFTGWT